VVGAGKQEGVHLVVMTLYAGQDMFQPLVLSKKVFCKTTIVTKITTLTILGISSV